MVYLIMDELTKSLQKICFCVNINKEKSTKIIKFIIM